MMEGICSRFGIIGRLVQQEELTSGNVNRTFRLRFAESDGTEKSYILQQVNTYAFQKPAELMENIDRVTAYLRQKDTGKPVLHFYDGCGGEDSRHNYYIAEDRTFWRLCDEIDSVVCDRIYAPQIARSAGQAFGAFQKCLSDFDPTQLHVTIPDFHNTTKRYMLLEDAVKRDELGRVSGAEAELRWLQSVKEKACRLSCMEANGRLPLRVTHNDTKISNLLFRKETFEPLTVIDLDTVMPGLIGHDFGDAIRSVENQCGSDDADLRMSLFDAFTEGFLSEVAAVLTEEEANTLALSCFTMSCELAVRYLTDYFNGDRYFKVRHDTENYLRACRQIALAKDMAFHLDTMNQIVQTYMTKYGKV